MHVKPFIKERRGRSRSSDQNVVKRTAPTRRDRRPHENGGPKSKRVRRSTSDQEEDSNSDDEEQEEEEEDQKANGLLEAEHPTKQVEDMVDHSEQNSLTDTEKRTGLVNGVKAEKDDEDDVNVETCHVNGDMKQEEMESEEGGAKPNAELQTQVLVQPERVTVSPMKTEPTGAEQNPSIQSESAPPAAETPPHPPPPVKPIRKQGFHNPNRFSREPLYRVIKNQPPPVLSINLDHNPFKCSAAGCTKSFRKAKLLHYHMKYYHGEDQPPEGQHSPTRSVHTRASEKQSTPAGLEAPKRRRTISASMNSGAVASPRGEVKTAGRRTSAPPAVSSQGPQQRALLREKSKENQLEQNTCLLQDKVSDKPGLDMGKDKPKERPKQRDFLRIKLKKKKKKKKAESDEDSISDWSTDSCGWSDDDLEVDLDVTTPPLSVDSGALDSSDQEIVRCICEVEEDNDFMIQCEECLCWQHGTCMGLLEDNVPERYTCYICRDPPGQRQSLRYWYDRDWLTSGHMYGLSILENYSHQNAKKITTTHQLLGDVHHVVENLNGLQLKMSILQSSSHPDLQLWGQPWKHLQRPRLGSDSRQGSNTAPSPVTPDEDMSRGEILMSNALEKLSRAAAAATSSSSSASSPFPSFQDSYIISEHCYQKPWAYYPAVEQRLVVETRQGSELEDSMRSTEELLEREQRYGSLLEVDKPKATSNKALMGVSWSPAEDKDSCQDTGDNRKYQQWQMNLLDHIDAVQDEVSHRMDFIERELDVLESWLDYTGELEPPEPLARLPQLKHRIKRLLSQLSKVQQIALFSST
uniref:PHD finger protein 20, a n=1 Tax=Nothobranchius korthausae TaxID=1143690 RepID=A0A1A8FM70_9TELE